LKGTKSKEAEDKILEEKLKERREDAKMKKEKEKEN
jgi:hypothetical protein